jgi:hypothetical protein
MTAVLPFPHAARRTSRLDDVHAVKAELQRLYDFARTDLKGENHAYVEKMARLLRFGAELCKSSDYDERLAAIEDALAGTPQTRTNGYFHRAVGERRQ